MLQKFFRTPRWLKHTVNIGLWVLFLIFAFGYFLGGFIAARLPPKQAIPVYRLAIRIFPWNPPNHHALGLTLLSQGDVEEAIIELRKAVKEAPNARYYNSLGYALLEKENFDEAIREFKEALRIDPNYSEPKKNLERAMFLKGKKDGEKKGTG